MTWPAHEPIDGSTLGRDPGVPLHREPARTDPGYSDCTDAELIDALEGLADGQDDDMGQLLNEAARRLRQHTQQHDLCCPFCEQYETSDVEALELHWRTCPAQH
jgi:hypothetical protein